MRRSPRAPPRAPHSHSRAILPSKETFRATPSMVRVILAWSASLPLSLPAAIARSTAVSMSRCDWTPTIFRNLRMLMLKASGSMSPPRRLFRGRNRVERVLERVLGERVHALGADAGLRPDLLGTVPPFHHGDELPRRAG